MRAAWPRTVGFLVATLGLAVAAAGSAGARAHEPSTGLKTLAFAKAPPDFGFDVGDGPKHLRDLVGRPVVLNFWATWCEPCRDELDSLVKMRETYGTSVVLLTIASQPRGVARSYLDEHLLGALPLIEDDEKKLSAAYSVGPIPATVVLARNGTVAKVMIGEVRWKELQSAVDAVLASGS
jgi:thiol-disulfide isomerase/thioredoxin